MKNTYRVGRRFRRLQYASVVVNSLIVFTFYFIYHYLFGEAFPQAVGAPMALGFLLLGILIARLTLRISDRYARGISYTVTDEGLLCRQLGRETLLRWASFSGAQRQEFRFRGVFPVEFQVDGKPMMLNQSIDDLCGLTAAIFTHIAPYAQLDPELIALTESLRGVY
ncbi:MAG: hypothetical protein K6G54_06445 [Oscillospiraceae bacterium]|nr:hypothetical protein [Oscillospiraceae bacterium]